MLLSEISKGGDIELDVKCNGKVMNFHSNIVEIHSNSILINALKVNDQTVGFSNKCSINFYYKTDGKLFLWENVEVKLVKYRDIVYHKIDLFGDGKPYNRRESFRMYIGEDMPLYVNTASGPIAVQVLVKDISETGVAIITKEEFDVERTVRLKLKDSHNTLSLSAVIVRKEFLEHLNAFLYGCKFIEKNSNLGKYIARKQGEQLRKKVSNFSSPPTRDLNNQFKHTHKNNSK